MRLSWLWTWPGHCWGLSPTRIPWSLGWVVLQGKEEEEDTVSFVGAAVSLLLCIHEVRGGFTHVEMRAVKRVPVEQTLCSLRKKSRWRWMSQGKGRLGCWQLKLNRKSMGPRELLNYRSPPTMHECIVHHQQNTYRHRKHPKLFILFFLFHMLHLILVRDKHHLSLSCRVDVVFFMDLVWWMCIFICMHTNSVWACWSSIVDKH